ncbi:MAG: hypothetical protein H6732_16355 [Alphaproteobacteria bacterium]|nr:hypothetical protein [Alphaproteobacteria bacterium]
MSNPEDRPLYVARPADLAALRAHWQAAKEGSPRVVRLVAPFGGGRRALTGQLLRELHTATDDAILWRVGCVDHETGLPWLLRAYGALVGQIASDVLLRGKVEMVLNGQLPKETKRVQGWFQAFVQALREAKPDASGQIQLRVAQDNPLVGLLEVVRAVCSRIPVVLELQQPHLVHSVLLAQLLEGLMEETKDGGRLLVILHDEPEGELRSSTHPAPLLDLFERRADRVTVQAIAPWGGEETAAYLQSRGLEGNAERIAAIAGGRPGFIAELTDILSARGQLADALEGVTFGSLTPMEVDEEELDVPDAPAAEGQRKHAGPDDAGQVAFFAALLGQAFPSALVAELGGYDKESIDDLCDAMDELFEEVQFNEQMGTWVYRFAHGAWREGVLERNDTDDGHQLARRVGVFMERFLAPRGLAFVSRTCRLYGEHGAPQRAQAMRQVALTSDDPNAWSLAWETLRYLDEVPWPDALRRSVATTLLEHLAASGPLQAADRVHGETTKWATEQGDEGLQAWLLLNGSKLDLRRQDVYRARDRARDALARFEKLEDRLHVAEAQIQLAGVELADGKPEAALEAAEGALKASMTDGADGQKVVPPNVAGQVEMIRGVVQRRAGKPAEAVEHFKRANEIAGTTGQGPLAVDAGVAMGEALLASRQIDPAREILGRVAMAARQIGQLARERAASELLAQAEGARHNFQGALQLAQRCLAISRQLELRQAIPVDLYHVGFFLLTQNKGKEALEQFTQVEQALGASAAQHPLYRDLAYHAGVAALQSQAFDRAETWLQRARPLLEQVGDTRKLVGTLDQLAALRQRAGKADEAKALLAEAVGHADKAQLKDEKKALQKRLESLA